MRSRSRWFASTAAWLTPAVLAAAAALPAMLVIAMPVPSNAIIPTLPIAPLWPPPTTMPATICGSRCAMTARMMHATIRIAKCGASGVLSAGGDQILQKFNANPDDQLHRHQANADA